jgi:putative membrane protein
MKTHTEKLALALKGMAMGIAEVIPGVSGGTIAFITGIYEELLGTIKNVLGPEAWQAWRRDGLAAGWEKANGTFLLFLLGGMALGIVIGVLGVVHLLENYPVLLWAFFFGLIIASAVFVGRQVGRWGLAEIAALVIGTAVAYLITVASPAEGNTALWFVFISGMIAISAMILPGISGSFILLLMGMYTYIIPTVKTALKTFSPESLAVLGAFGIGCLIGLATFSRVLSWIFKHYHSPTMAALTGFMLGSLNKIWPWRKPVLGLTESGEMVDIQPGMMVDKVIKEANLLPAQYAAEVGPDFLIGALLAMAAGFALVFVLERVGTSR